MTTKQESKRIESVTIKRILDEDSDTSWLGEFADQPTNDFAIVHIYPHKGEFVKELPCECGHMHKEIEEGYAPCPDCDCDYTADWPERGREYRFFNSASIEKDNSDEENRMYAKQDYERMDGLNQGEWCFIGVRAEAIIRINDLRQSITSGGLWGIESDSDSDYFAEVEQEQLAELKSQLHAIGFSKRAIAAAFRNVEREDN